MSELLNPVYRPSQVEYDKNIRYLKSIDLPHIGITTHGDIYNVKMNRWLNTNKAKRMTFVNTKNENKNYSVAYLYKIAFKYDDESPESILKITGDIKNEILDTWNFYHTEIRKSVFDLNCLQHILADYPKNFLLNDVFVTKNGFYNINHEKYYTKKFMSDKLYYQLPYSNNGKKIMRMIDAKKIISEIQGASYLDVFNKKINNVSEVSEEFESLETQDNIEEPIESNESVQNIHEVQEAVETFENAEIAEDKTEISKNLSSNIEPVDLETTKNALAFINDCLSYSKEELCKKYNINEKILNLFIH